jgi:Glycosyl transferase family 11
MRGAIEVVMEGGLGNAMFQYAVGRALAVRHNRPLVLDTSLAFHYPERAFDLPCFRLGEHRVRELPYCLWSARRSALRGLDRVGLAPIRWVEEPEGDLWFRAEVLQVRPPCVLKGYWQSERYFTSIKTQLREDFTIVRAQDERSAACQARMQRVPSIGLHVRRGDYLEPDDPHSPCSLEYYEAALRLIEPRLGPGTELFVFSDDIPWAREHIRFDLPTVFVDWNTDRNYEDLRLMSACRALIAANSTFSWWGGWLNPRTDKIVVVPKNWYRTPGLTCDLPDSAWATAI